MSMNLFFETMNIDHIPLIANDFEVCDIDGNKLEYFKQYLIQNAILDAKEGYGKTHLLIGKDTNKETLIGFYTLRSSCLIISSLDMSKKYGEPALEIYEFAINKNYLRQGYGRIMMKNIISQAYNLNENSIGIRHLVVCAKKSAVDFYSKFKFKEIDVEGNIPRTYDNQNCIGMSVRLSFKED